MCDGTVPRREDLCGKYYCAVRSKASEVQRYLAFPIRCGSWDCPPCRRYKANSYQKRMKLLYDGRGLWFYTLTYYHNLTPGEAWSTYNRAWNRLRTNAAKKYGSFNYVRVLESHNSSPYPHLHVIADLRIPVGDFGKIATAAGFGYQIKEAKISTENAMNYIAKYLTKEWRNEESWALRKNYRCRIISFSRGLLSPKVRSGQWDALLVGTDLARCVDHIRTDYQWDTNRHAAVVSETETDTFYDVSIIWTDREPNALIRKDDDWQPDDWVPK